VTDEVALRRAEAQYALVLPWAFRDEFIKREESLRDSGTSLLFPLPNIEVVV
jgi:NDP-4-keto-2,6-dideoxyhexose 3-C-methyltransferase